MQYKVKYKKTFTWKQINIDMGKVGETIEEEMNFVENFDFNSGKLNPRIYGLSNPISLSE